MEKENDCFICICTVPYCMIFPGRGRKCASALNVASPVSVKKNTALSV